MTASPAGTPAEQIAGLRSLAERLAREAGDLVAAGRRNGIASLTTKSSVTDPVTEFDRASEQLIVEQLLTARPYDSIVGEEGTATDGSSGVSWLIDPIDGTTNFLYDLPGYAVSIAAADSLGTLVGAVYVPSFGELYSATRGQGATVNGITIRCGTNDVLSSALVGTGFSYLPERRGAQAERLGRMMPYIRDIRRFGAAAADLCLVACGRLDVYFEEHLGPWDLAAGELIASEAGCRTGDFHGGAVRPEQVLACNPALFDAMAALLVRSS